MDKKIPETIAYICTQCKEGFVQPVSVYEDVDSYRTDKWFECNQCHRKEKQLFGVIQKVPLDKFNSQPWAPAYPYNLIDFEKCIPGDEEKKELETRLFKCEKKLEEVRPLKAAADEHLQQTTRVLEDFDRETYKLYREADEYRRIARDIKGIAKVFFAGKRRDALEKSEALTAQVRSRNESSQRKVLEDSKNKAKENVFNLNFVISFNEDEMKKLVPRLQLLKKFF